MKLTSKDKIINESISEKIDKARKLQQQDKHFQAIQAYHKVLFLKEDPQYMYELAEIYEKILDFSSASLFYRRVHQLNNSSLAFQKVKYFAKVKGLQLLEIGSVKNILQDTQFQIFKKRYPTFHKRLFKKVAEKALYKQYLHSGLAYLEVNHRQLALNEIDNCIIIEEKDVDLLIFRAMIYWSILQNQKGYKQFWNAYILDKTNPQVVLFLQMIQPEIQTLYKQAKYDLIDRKVQKCRLKVKKALQIHPYHTQLLILSAYLHRNKEEYEKALSDLQLANKHLEDQSLQGELRNQISLTYNEMGIYLYKQNKFNEAITLFTQGLTFNAKDWGIITNRGDCYRSLNDFVKALEDYTKAFEIEKKNQELNFRISSIYSLRGVALFNSKNYELALKEFQQAINFSPRCPQFYLSKGKCLLQLGRKQQSVQSLQKCLQLDDKQVQAAQFLSQLKEGQQRRGKNNRKIIFLSKEK